MTSNDMKFSFQLKFDSLFEFSAPAYDDRQISYLLTEAQFRVFIKRYNPLANKYQKGFEADEQRRRDLEQLIKPAYYNAEVGYTYDDGVEEISTDETKQGGVHPNGIFMQMPTDFLYAVEEAIGLTETSSGSDEPKEAWVKPVKHDEYLANINNPYKQPYKDLIWRMDISRFEHVTGTASATSANSKRTELILPDGYTLNTYRVRYLATPPEIVVDEFDPPNQVHCILDETLHREIVDEAVIIAQAAVKPQEYQIGVSEQQRND